MGLRFRGLRIINQCYVIKLVWQLIDSPEKLWVRFLRSKYGCGSLTISVVKDHYRSSHVWCGIDKMRHHVHEGVSWAIHNGHQVHFWKDFWVPRVGRLMDSSSGSVPCMKNGRPLCLSM